MTAKNKGLWTIMGTVSIGVLAYVGAMVWMPPSPPLLVTHTHTDAQYSQQLMNIEQAVTALAQELHAKRTQDTRPEPTRVAVQMNDEASRQALARMIREEVRHAVADASPEAQHAREEAITEAQVLNSPENRAAYQSAADVVHGAMAAKRWTEEAKEAFQAAFGLLTNTQRMELMNMLAPAINGGEIKVEVRGPLF